MTRHLMAAVGISAIALSVASAPGCATNPVTGKRQLVLISEAHEIEMGRQADKEAVASFGLYQDDALQQYVHALGTRVAATTERPTLPWTFRVVDESQADAFGLKYMMAGGYDPRKLVDVFTMLQNLTQQEGAGRLPQWMSTHPNPENRLAWASATVAGLQTDLLRLAVNRPDYVRRLDGIVFGESPREGFFQDVMKRPPFALNGSTMPPKQRRLAMTCMGIDLGKVHLQICEISDAGEMWEKRIRTERLRIAEVLEGRPPARILIEACTDSEWVARLLEGLGHEVIVADPNFAPMYARRSRQVKTDRRDALALAEACRLGAYRRAHRTSDPRRHVRGLLAVREGLVRARTRWILLVRAILRREGLQVRSGHAESFAKRVGELSLPDHLRAEIAPLLTCLTPLNRELAALDDHLAGLVTADEAATRLTSVPGVGPVTALSFVATVDRVERFESAHQVASYLGLVPREWSSSETLRRGRITKAGNKRTRWLLAEAARSLLRFKGRPETERLRTWAEQIAARRGSGVAVVALARRLSGILFALWRDGTLYDPELLERGTTAKRAA